MEYLLQILLWCPRCWRAIGGTMYTVCSAFALVGWRLVLRADRIEHKTGVLVALDKVFASIPLPIPTTRAGVALAAAGAILGWVLARFGKWAENQF